MTEEVGFKIELKKATFEKGYNSHGYWTTFEDIVETEMDRGNSPFIDMNEEDVAKLNLPAIWICYNPLDAFRYAIDADDYHLTLDEINEKYPDWKEEVCEIDCTNLYTVKDTDDCDGGILMVKKE